MGDLFLNSNQYERLAEGAVITIQVLVYSFLLGVVLSLVFGVARLSSRRIVRGLALGYVELFRGVSSIVLLFWMAFALPILLGVDQESKLSLGSIALGLNMGGYGAEIVRGAIQSVPKGQEEASIALNLTPTQRLRHVVLPQAMPVILPPMGNLTIEILKGTALVSLIGLADLTFEAQKIRVGGVVSSDRVEVPILYLNVLVIYFVLSQIVSLLYRLAERRVNKRYGQRTGRAAATILQPGAAAAPGVSG
ncbi:MAG: ectoine/hydroxyectoine ABC transporter permease subunit EhuC [Actinomycetota bacterium]|nr:ectoine/hydroxyectoine ABC transporter permease subunit EhuC [Actinomycetota bacterium]